jgi:hypothetical protein
MPVAATMVFFPMDENIHSRMGLGPERAEDDGEVIIYCLGSI